MPDGRDENLFERFVGTGIYASVLHVIGLLDDFADIANLSNDKLG